MTLPGVLTSFHSLIQTTLRPFTVLKDASATAIYGSRASNGVFLSQPKKGKAGSKMSITYNGNTSISSAIKFLDVYTGDQLRQIALDHIDLMELIIK